MMAKKQLMTVFCLLLMMTLQACERDLSSPTASLSINNLTDLRLAPEQPLSIWAVYITPANSLTPAIDRSHDLLASAALEPGISQTFIIDSCGQQLLIQVVFSDGSEQLFSSAAAVECGTTYSQDVL
ncbi:MAG: hypothetical protein OEY11_11830 [Gammaproteobacteria bacterium]|nr:hypothetical protein [Gammaproteobacteria bacterium]